jgi:hypothetical protein
MSSSLEKIEEKITDFWTGFFKSTLFFLSKNQQSIFVSFIHYIIFIIGFYYFFFKSQPGSIFRVIFFIFVVLGALSYFIFNRCFFTSIELSLSDEKNSIQKLVDRYFGKEIEGNITSKIVLSVGVIITGLVLLKDYGYFKFSNIRDA